MIECHLKGFRDTYKARSRVGLGKGSHSPSQRVVEALADRIEVGRDIVITEGEIDALS